MLPFGVLWAASLCAQRSQSIAKICSAERKRKTGEMVSFLSKIYIRQKTHFSKLSLAVILVKTIK